MTAPVVSLEVRVAQAQRAAAKGNLRMAELYTDRALQLVKIEREEIRKAKGIANRKLRAHRMNSGLSGFVSGFSEIITEAFQPLIELARSVSKATAGLTQQDFALVDADQRLLDAMYAVQAGEPLTEEQRRFL